MPLVTYQRVDIPIPQPHSDSSLFSHLHCTIGTIGRPTPPEANHATMVLAPPIIGPQDSPLESLLWRKIVAVRQNLGSTCPRNHSWIRMGHRALSVWAERLETLENASWLELVARDTKNATNSACRARYQWCNLLWKPVQLGSYFRVTRMRAIVFSTPLCNSWYTENFGF